MAYEIVCDLRYTAMLEHATDKLLWSKVEMSLCEYDKYVRLLLGEGKAKRGYDAA